MLTKHALFLALAFLANLAHAGPYDALTSAVSFTDALAALAGIAAALGVFFLARNGLFMVVELIKGKAK